MYTYVIEPAKINHLSAKTVPLLGLFGLAMSPRSASHRPKQA